MNLHSLKTIKIEIENGIGWIILDRPEKLNAMDLNMLEEIGEAAIFTANSKEIRVAIITGRGRAFSSGLDLGIVSSLREIDIFEFRSMVRSFQQNFHAFELMEKPVIAMVNGPALGAGMELILACDIVSCSKAAEFGLLEVNLGLVTDLGASFRLPRAIGMQRAKELILTGRKINASEALRIGLVNAIHPPENLKEKTESIARSLMKLSQEAISLNKSSLIRNQNSCFGTALEYDALAQTAAIAHIKKLLESSKSGNENGKTES
ncbi:MAG: enoyl-CoA hydratase/isomerase family protein [Actinomycetota bacterium]|nr:enoyl-CoA hydratase/isomerase family protein [Actinomycetota bacterium]